MSEVPFVSLVISSNMPDEEVESLLSSIRLTSAKIQQLEKRAFIADDIIALITVAVGLGQIAEYGIKIAKAINNWRRKAKEKGIQVEVKLERPDREPLDLNTAADEEVDEWLSK
jgi:hypothetical protein